MSANDLYQRLIEGRDIAVGFGNYNSFKVFCSFLRTVGIVPKRDLLYYWNKYDTRLAVTITEKFNFKCGSVDFYCENGREIHIYNIEPILVELIDVDLEATI